MTRDELRAKFQARSRPQPQRKVVEGFGPIYMRVLTVATADQNRKLFEENKADDGRDQARRFALLLVDENDELLFDISNPDDIDTLHHLDLSVFNGAFQASVDANTLEEDKDEDGGNA